MVMADSLSAQSVGREFVKQYYTMMHEAPNYLHRFYSNNSSFVHSSIDQPGEDQPVIIGQQEIHKKIMSLNYRDCHAKIRQVDSQASVADGVIIQVIGELSNDGGPLHPFVQTFVLVAQSPRKYYVHNDIFRYLDGVIHEKSLTGGSTSDSSNVADDVIHTDGTCNGSLEQAPEHVQELATTYYQQPSLVMQQPVSNGIVHINNEPEVVPQDLAPPVVEQVAEPVVVNPPETEDGQLTVTGVSSEPEEHVETHVEPEEPKVEQSEEPINEQEAVVEPEAELPVEAEPKVAKPVTWAAMASKTPASVPQTRVAQAPARVVKPSTVRAPPEAKPEANQTSHSALPQRAARTNATQEVTEHESTRSQTDGDDSRRPQIPQQNYPDSQQIFVGNLPQYLSDKDLREFFSQYGEVIEMKINRKSGNLNNLPYFGFVVFDNAETVQKVLSHRPLFLTGGNGKHRINVEEKKPRAELQASRPRSASRGGARPTGSYGRGSDAYNRSGGGRPGASSIANSAAEADKKSGTDDSPSISAQ